MGNKEKGRGSTLASSGISTRRIRRPKSERSTNSRSNRRVASLKFNDAQIEAIEAGPGIFRVSAGPGSGKTRVAVERIVRLIQDGVDPKNIIATTFTKKAAGEMNNRLEEYGVTTVAVQTMHSFCFRVLKREGVYDNWEVDDTGKYGFILKDITGWKGMKWKGVDLTTVEQFIADCKNSLVRPEECEKSYPNYDPRYAEAYFRAEERRQMSRIVTFDDMLIDGVELLRQEQSVRERYQNLFEWVLVDEFQDSNLAQLALTDLLAAPQWNLMIIGDVDQAIYEWRGAKPQFMVDFDAMHEQCKTITMGINYRCAPNIVHHAAKCIEHNEHRITKELTASRDKDGIILVRVAPDLDGEADVLADEVDLLKADGVAYKDMMVLYRTNAQSRAIEEVFSKRSVPFVIYGSVSFYERKEVQDLLSYLRLLDDPRDVMAGERAINRPFRFIGRMVLEQIAEQTKEFSGDFVQAAAEIARSGKGGTRIAEFVNLMSHLRMIEKESRPSELIQVIVEQTNYINYLRESEGSDTTETSREDNIGEVIRSAERFKTVSDFLKFVKFQISQRKKKKPKDAIQCMTIHRAKGLESDAVFIIGANNGIIPHAKSEEPFEEERRLFYVAMTRAMRYLHISVVDALGSKLLEPSQFIHEAGLATKMEHRGTPKECVKFGSSNVTNGMIASSLVHHDEPDDDMLDRYDNLD